MEPRAARVGKDVAFVVVLVALRAAAGTREAVEVGNILVVGVDWVDRRSGIVCPLLGGVRVRVRDQKPESVLVEVALRELELGAVASLDSGVEPAAQPKRQPDAIDL